MKKCDKCGRKRTKQDGIDYNEMQVVFNTKIGWYSSEDGEICGDCMTETIRGPK